MSTISVRWPTLKVASLLTIMAATVETIDEEICWLEQIQEKERIERNEKPHEPTALRCVTTQHLSVLQCDLLTHYSTRNVANGFGPYLPNMWWVTFRYSVWISCKNMYPENFKSSREDRMQRGALPVIWNNIREATDIGYTTVGLVDRP